MEEFVTLDNVSTEDIFPNVSFQLFPLFCFSEIVMIMINWKQDGSRFPVKLVQCSNQLSYEAPTGIAR